MNNKSLIGLFLVFLRFGIVGFGGPIALIALMEQELCKKRNWYTVEEFTQVYAICKLLPGPIAIQVAIYLGYKRQGRVAGLLAGLGLTLPALCMILVLSFLYVKYGSTSSKFNLIANFMQNAALAVILLVTLDLGRVYVKSSGSIVIFIIAGILIFYFPTWEPLIIISFGVLGLIITYRPQINNNFMVAATMFDGNLWHQISAIAISPKFWGLFWVCFKASEFIFGTGLAIIPLLEGELVQHLHWMSERQFIDGITFGQITPGPVSISVVFFGYIVSGFSGALAATLGFYLPPLINTLVILPIIWNRIIRWRHLNTFSVWAFPAIIGGIASSSVKIGMTSLASIPGWITLIIAFIIAYNKLLPTWLLIPAAGLAGVIVVYI